MVRLAFDQPLPLAGERHPGYAAAMLQISEPTKENLMRLCQAYGVVRLDLFGSAATARFDPAESDLDFIAEFADKQPGTYADRYYDFATALEDLFHHRVDLLTDGSIRSPLFRQEVEASRRVIYDEASHQKAA